MKKRTLLAASAFVFMFASVMMSCGGSQEQKPATDSTTSEVTTPATEGTTTTANASTTTPANVYACEMKCEGEGKTYTEAGKCPKCGMELKQTTSTTTETTTK